MSTSRYVSSPWRMCKRLRLCDCPSTVSNTTTTIHPFVVSIPSRVITSSSSPSRPATTKDDDASSEASISSSSSPPATNSPKRQQFGLPAMRPQDEIREELVALARSRGIDIPDELNIEARSRADNPRLPRSVQALYLRPLRREPTHGIPVANLQLRSYSVRNLEFVADFAVRAAYYLNLPARGPVPLPRITQRYTVPRSNFIFKKSQENWERVTLRRLVQIQDGDPESVQRWLAFVRKWAWYGVGMKADVFEFEDVNVVKRLDSQGEDAIASGIEGVRWEFFGTRKSKASKEQIQELMKEQGFDMQNKGTKAQAAAADASV